MFATGEMRSSWWDLPRSGFGGSLIDSMPAALQYAETLTRLSALKLDARILHPNPETSKMQCFSNPGRGTQSCAASPSVKRQTSGPPRSPQTRLRLSLSLSLCPRTCLSLSLSLSLPLCLPLLLSPSLNRVSTPKPSTFLSILL